MSNFDFKWGNVPSHFPFFSFHDIIIETIFGLNGKFDGQWDVINQIPLHHEGSGT